MGAKEGRRIKYISFINAVAAVAVLTLHTNGCFWSFSATELYWKIANVIEGVFYFAVPLFFMVSGITLMDFYERDTISSYFLKRFRKVFIPFIAWSIIGLIEKVCIHAIDIHDITPKYIYEGIVGTKIVKIYWFFTSLFILYLSMPLFAAVDKKRRKEVFSYAVIIGFILNQAVPFIKNLFSLDITTPYVVIAVSGVLLWPPLGWLLHNCELSRKQKVLIYSISVLGLLIHITGTYYLSMKAGHVVKVFKGYQNVPSVLYSVGVFVFLKDIGNKIMDGKAATFINWFSKYTFPIYLMQFILLDRLPRLPFVDTHSVIYILGAPFVIIPIIILITWCMRKVPGLKVILP